MNRIFAPATAAVTSASEVEVATVLPNVDVHEIGAPFNKVTDSIVE